MKNLCFIFFLLWPTAANAAIIYVDKDNPCPGNGSTASPYCSIQNGLNHPHLKPGDTIRIRDSLSPYNENAVTPTGLDGTAANPIVIEPDIGNHPTLLSTSTNLDSGVITISNGGYWMIRNMTFDACGIPTSSKQAIKVQPAPPGNPNRSVVGIVITGNTIKCWGGSDQGGASHDGTTVYNTAAIRIEGTSIAPGQLGYSTQYTTATISNNTISRAKETGIFLQHNSATVVSRNTITGTRCGVHSKINDYRAEEGIKIAFDGKNNIITQNDIHDFQDEAGCYSAISNRPEGYNVTVGGIYCDTGSTGDLVERNRIYSMNLSNSGSGQSYGNGIFWESRCRNGTIRGNFINGILSDDGAGISTGTTSCSGNTGNSIWENMIYNVKPVGIVLRNYAQNITVKNNIIWIHEPTWKHKFIEVSQNAANCGGHVINGNQYHYTGSILGYQLGTISDFLRVTLGTLRTRIRNILQLSS